jgi:hypothetical protein
MKKWITQTSTIVGLIGLAITGMQLYQSGGDWITIAIGVMSGFALLINDKGAAAFLVLGFGLGATACGASLADLPIDDAQKISIAVEAGCLAAEQAGCLETPEIQGVIGALINSAQCVDSVSKMVEEKKVTIDLKKITRKNPTCKSFLKALGV